MTARQREPDSNPLRRHHPSGARVWARVRQVGIVLALLVLAASALYGGDVLGVRTRLQGSAPPPPRPPAAGRAAGVSTPTASGEQTRVRSYPWWQSVATLQGVGPSMQTLSIDEGAIQWRAKWSCESGRLLVGAADNSRPLVDATCPGGAVSYSAERRDTTLDIQAEGPWRLEIEQQIDLPLAEPPLPAMTASATAPLTKGSFYNIDQSGRGRVTIYRLADGAHALRLDDFFVTPNVDLELRLSPLEAPRSTEEFASAPSALVSRLDITAGSMNFIVPSGVDPTSYRSVVIWCPPVHSAYAAATLVPAS